MFRSGPTFPWLFNVAMVILLAALVMWGYRRIRSEISRPIRRQLVALRLAVLVLIGFCLLDLFWVREVRYDEPGTVAVILDSSRSMALQDGGEQRMAEARQAIKTGILPTLPSSMNVEKFRLGEVLSPVRDLQWGTPDGRASNLVDGLLAVWTTERKEALRAVVLVSDGANTSATPVETAAGLFRRKGVPIHTVAVGGHGDTPDIVIESIEAPRVVWTGRPVTVRVLLRSPGFANQAVPIRIEQGGKFIVEDTVQLNGEAQEISLAMISRDPGFHFLEIQIPQQLNERLSANNRRSFGIQVVTGKPRIALLDGGDGSLDIVKPILEKELGATVTTIESGTGWGSRMADWIEFDGIIISNQGAATCPGEWLGYLHRWVNEFGGGIMLLGGPPEFGANRWQGTSAERLLPFLRGDGNTLPPIEEAFFLKAADDALDQPMLEVGETRAASRVVWESKPPIFGGMNRLGGLKPGSLVLSYHPQAKDAAGPLPVWVTREVGQGRVFTFATSINAPWGTWFSTEWGEAAQRGKPSDAQNNDLRYFRRFWTRTGEWLTARKTVRDYQPATLELARHVAFVHERVRVLVRVLDRELQPVSNAEVDVGFAGDRASKTRAVFDESLRAFFIDVQADKPGDYQVAATVRTDGELIQLETPLRVLAVDLESYDARANPEFLARLSDLTGGASLKATDEQLLSAMETAVGRPGSKVLLASGSIWNHPFTLLLIIALLSMEWILRRKSGLA